MSDNKFRLVKNTYMDDSIKYCVQENRIMLMQYAWVDIFKSSDEFTANQMLNKHIQNSLQETIKSTEIILEG